MPGSRCGNCLARDLYAIARGVFDAQGPAGALIIEALTAAGRDGVIYSVSV